MSIRIPLRLHINISIVSHMCTRGRVKVSIVEAKDVVFATRRTNRVRSRRSGRSGRTRYSEI